MLKKIVKWLPAAFIAACSFYFSSKSQLQYMPSFWNADKAVHLCCYAGFSFWIAFACNIRTFKQFWIPILMIAVWGVTDEFHQSFVPYREPSFLDWCADTFGAAIGAFIYVFVGVKVIDWICGRFLKQKN